MKNTVKRHWEHLEYYPFNEQMLIVLSCGHMHAVNVVSTEAGSVRTPPRDETFDCAECTKSWKDNLK